MGTMPTTNLANLLTRTGFFSEAQIAALLLNSQKNGVSITEAVVGEGYAREEEFLQALGALLKVPFVELDAAMIEPGVLERLPPKAIFQYNVIPVSMENGSLVVATNDLFNAGLVDALRLASGSRVRLVLSSSVEIARAVKKFYGVGADTVAKMIQDDRIEVAPEDSLMQVDLDEMDQEASVVKFVNQIIWEAYQERATDIHLEPMEKELRIRYRVDGVLHQTPLPPQLTRFQASIISRIKVMANVDIAEKRLPQDGRIKVRMQGEDIDIRVSTMPTVYGESVSLRLLMRGKEMIGFNELGMYPQDEEIMRRLITKPNGILLVTGPTGSGKSTSLYSYLREINSIDKRIITVEDPIEYEMPGINQINVRPEIGLSFATALRHILRQDPNIIMVGEVRDLETAEIAIRASLTGHLVLSTLHTNDAAGAITRLIDMGVEPFLVASALEGIVAQRLVRRLCAACRAPHPVDDALVQSVGFPPEYRGRTIYEPAGCEKCRTTGYRGRTGIYEILQVTEGIEPLITARSATSAIKQRALAEGMRTLRNDGWMKVLDGTTTVKEVIRVSEEAD